MKKYDYSLTIGILILMALVFYAGREGGRENVCDTLRGAFLDNSRVGNVISDQFGQGYLDKIKDECRW